MVKEKLGIYFIGCALSTILLLMLGILALVIIKSAGIFWQKPMQYWHLKDGTQILGEFYQKSLDRDQKEIIKIKIANRDIWKLGYRWIKLEDIAYSTYPKDAIKIKRLEYGDFFGYFDKEKFLNAAEAFEYAKSSIKDLKKIIPEYEAITWQVYQISDEIFEKQNILKAIDDRQKANQLNVELDALKIQISALTEQQTTLRKKIDSYRLPLMTADGKPVDIAAAGVLDILQPNQMGIWHKLAFYLSQLWKFLIENPREANTEGGVFPAIFGTVVMVFLMSILSFPLGVMSAIYIREYAKEGWLLNMVRITVNNLAGVPSIVYGIFGLGFFVYGIGGSIDKIFFSETLPTPTFGTGGVLWASLTLGLLTMPVVIVSTEEALAAIPRGMREASYALGANKLQTLVKVIIPMASPGMITGFILSIARATGEVAPLMLTGVVKLTSYLPIDAEFPYLHLNRKFMHLGFHIFDVGFQSPNIEDSKPIVYLTTLLLIIIVVLMTSIAVYIRAKVINKHSTQSI